MSEVTDVGLSNTGLGNYEISVLANAKLEQRVNIFDSQLGNFQVRTGVDDINDATYAMSDRIAEHINLALTGFSHPDKIGFESSPTGTRQERLAKSLNSAQIKKINYETGEAEEVLSVEAVDSTSIKVSSMNEEILNFAKKVVEAGLPFPKRKLKSKSDS